MPSIDWSEIEGGTKVRNDEGLERGLFISDDETVKGIYKTLRFPTSEGIEHSPTFLCDVDLRVHPEGVEPPTLRSVV
jgi:hypothetical protein